MDRPIRPLFPAGFFDEVQIQANVLASDRQNAPDVLAMNGASAALSISALPFMGPLGSVRLAQIDGQFVPFPTIDQLEESDLDLVVSGSKSAILMIEGFAREMPEDRMLEALDECHRIIRMLCEMQEELVARAGKPKKQYVLADYSGLTERITRQYYGELKSACAIIGTARRRAVPDSRNGMNCTRKSVRSRCTTRPPGTGCCIRNSKLRAKRLDCTRSA
jgi:polyribonucleotide nucleotidyltransferase